MLLSFNFDWFDFENVSFKLVFLLSSKLPNPGLNCLDIFPKSRSICAKTTFLASNHKQKLKVKNLEPQILVRHLASCHWQSSLLLGGLYIWCSAFWGMTNQQVNKGGFDHLALMVISETTKLRWTHIAILFKTLDSEPWKKKLFRYWEQVFS